MTKKQDEVLREILDKLHDHIRENGYHRIMREYITQTIRQINALFNKKKSEAVLDEDFVRSDAPLRRSCNCDREENKQCKNCGGWY